MVPEAQGYALGAAETALLDAAVAAAVVAVVLAATATIHVATPEPVPADGHSRAGGIVNTGTEYQRGAGSQYHDSR